MTEMDDALEIWKSIPCGELPVVPGAIRGVPVQTDAGVWKSKYECKADYLWDGGSLVRQCLSDSEEWTGEDPICSYDDPILRAELVGGIVGGVVFILVIVLSIDFIYQRKKKSKSRQHRRPSEERPRPTSFFIKNKLNYFAEINREREVYGDESPYPNPDIVNDVGSGAGNEDLRASVRIEDEHVMRRGRLTPIAGSKREKKKKKKKRVQPVVENTDGSNNGGMNSWTPSAHDENEQYVSPKQGRKKGKKKKKRRQDSPVDHYSDPYNPSSDYISPPNEYLQSPPPPTSARPLPKPQKPFHDNPAYTAESGRGPIMGGTHPGHSVPPHGHNLPRHAYPIPATPQYSRERVVHPNNNANDIRYHPDSDRSRSEYDIPNHHPPQGRPESSSRKRGYSGNNERHPTSIYKQYPPSAGHPDYYDRPQGVYNNNHDINPYHISHQQQQQQQHVISRDDGYYNGSYPDRSRVSFSNPGSNFDEQLSYSSANPVAQGIEPMRESYDTNGGTVW